MSTSRFSKASLLSRNKYFYDCKSLMDYDRSSKFKKHKSFKIFLDLMENMNLTYEARDKYIDECIQLLEMTIQKLDYEKQNHPLSIMGLVTSKELIKTIYTTTISVLFAMSQFLYQKYK